MDSRISGHTGLLALIGSPVGHSGSPAMYNYSFERLGLDYVYVAFDIKVEEVADAIAAMRTFKMRGCNVTMPCKTEVVRYMGERLRRHQIIGAVNTVVRQRQADGHITDGEGFVHNLKDHGIDIKGKKITVAGGGGAATAIQVQCALDGAREISIFNIKDAFFERTLKTAEKIRAAVPSCVVNVYDIADTARMTAEIASSDIFANATIVGMKPMENESVVKDTSAFRPGLVVADAVYNPEETRLLREAKEAGATCIGGKGMAAVEGVAAFKLYTREKICRSRKSKSVFLARKVKLRHEEFISDRLYGRREKYHCESACEKMSVEANRDGSAHRGTTGDGNHRYFCRTWGELFPRPGDRVVAVFFGEHRICGILRRRQCTQG